MGGRAHGWPHFPRTSLPYCGTCVATAVYQGNHRRHHGRRGGKRRICSSESLRLTWPMRVCRRCNVSRSPANCLSRSWMSAWVWCNSSGFHGSSSSPSLAFSGACRLWRRGFCRSLNLPSEKAFMATLTHFFLSDRLKSPATMARLTFRRIEQHIRGGCRGLRSPSCQTMAAAITIAMPRINAATTMATAGLRWEINSSFTDHGVMISKM